MTGRWINSTDIREFSSIRGSCGRSGVFSISAAPMPSRSVNCLLSTTRPSPNSVSAWRVSHLLAMPMLVSGLVAGFIVGLAAGGDWHHLEKLDLKLWPALFVGVLARVIAPFLGGLALASSVAGLALVSLVALANRALPGALLIAAGSLLHAGVLSITGGMPIDPVALPASAE